MLAREKQPKPAALVDDLQAGDWEGLEDGVEHVWVNRGPGEGQDLLLLTNLDTLDERAPQPVGADVGGRGDPAEMPAAEFEAASYQRLQATAEAA